MQPDSLSLIKEEPLKILLKAFGWKLVRYTAIDGVAFFRPDFYQEGHIIAISKRGRLTCSGDSLIEYKGTNYESVSDLYEDHPNAINHFNDWIFHEQKEWVISRTGKEFLGTFTTLDTVLPSKTFRC
jgi:hypothetical protein